MLTRRRAAALPLAALLLALTSSPAAADESDPVHLNTDASAGQAAVDVTAKDQGHSGASPGNSAASTSTNARTAGARRCSYLGKPIDCTDSAGEWSDDQQCWVQRMSPQPPADDPIWNGHAGGVIYWCQDPINPGDGAIGGGHMFWAPAAGTTGAPVRVDPVALAEEAIERMDLVGAAVGATPLNDGEGIVGLQTWLWVANDGPDSMGPISRTATAESVSVTATAKVTQLEWDMGNGDVQRCSNAGTEWRRGRGTGDSPTCGYTYYQDSGDQPDGAYTITPTAHWRVEWAGAGQSGVITFTLTGHELAMPIVELQTVRTGP